MPAIFLILILLSALSYLIYHYKIKTTTDFKVMKEFLPLMGIFAFILLLNALFALWARSAMGDTGKTPPVDSLRVMSDYSLNKRILITGIISDKNPTLREDYVAYYENKPLWTPEKIILQLKDGDINLVGKQYLPEGWNVDYTGHHYIAIGDHIIVKGILVSETVKDEKGVKSKISAFDPEIIYPGSHSKFKAKEQVKSIITLILAMISFIASLLSVGFPLVHALRCWIRQRATT